MSSTKSPPATKQRDVNRREIQANISCTALKTKSTGRAGACSRWRTRCVVLANFSKGSRYLTPTEGSTRGNRPGDREEVRRHARRSHQKRRMPSSAIVTFIGASSRLVAREVAGQSDDPTTVMRQGRQNVFVGSSRPKADTRSRCFNGPPRR